MNLSALIIDPVGPVLSEEEKAFFREMNPYGYILFARHCEDPKQVRKLIDELKTLSGREQTPILIDQEGGRVARLKPPHWAKYPPADAFAQLARRDLSKAERATFLNARLIAQELQALGINVDCAPLADLPQKNAHDVIGDRAFGTEPQQVIRLARAMADGLQAGGVVPVLKHIPGHGRAAADSHEELPVVGASLEELRAHDFAPFKALADLPMAMTAHVLYTAIDPEHMATLSKKTIQLIRHEIGFAGLLLSDDISMKAMAGDLTQRARDTLAAGCDIVLHCNGSFADKKRVADGVAPLTGAALDRAQNAMSRAGDAQPFDAAATRAELAQALAVAA